MKYHYMIRLFSLLFVFHHSSVLGKANQHFVETGTFRHHPGIRIELVVAEPDVVDPVALTFTADGSMYVVEMRDYPYGKGPTGSPGGTIRKLVFNQAGQVVSSHVFAEQLSYPTSIAAFRDGVVVAAKDLIYLADLDGDHVADIRETVVSGFDQSVTDSNFSGLRWGLDNRLHGVNGGNDGNLIIPGTQAPALPLSGADFTWDPFNQTLQRTYHTGGGFGLVFDDFGSSFTPHNIDHIKQRILPVSALERFRGFPPTKATLSISDHGAMARIFPVSKAETRVNHPEQAGYFSSSGGMGFLTGAFADTELAGGVLVCDVVSNLVHRDVMHHDGPIFQAQRAPEEQHRDFIASRESTFRPVGLEPGPDGNLYLIDMQRSVIEHPDYIPQQIMDRYDIREGDDRGRIYRVIPTATKHTNFSNLASLSSKELLKQIGSPNRWTRVTAQRLILERKDLNNRNAFTQALDSKNPLTRMHTLWAMHGLGSLDRKDIEKALDDSHPGIRSQGLWILTEHPEWWNATWSQVLSLSEDKDASVRFHTALMLGNHPHPDNLNALKRLLITDRKFRWSRLAVMSSLKESPSELLTHLWQALPREEEELLFSMACLEDIAYMAGSRLDAYTTPLVTRFLEAIYKEKESQRVEMISSLFEGLSKGARRASISQNDRLMLKTPLGQWAQHPSLNVRRTVWEFSQTIGFEVLPGFEKALSQAITRASDRTLPTAERLGAVDLLGLGTFDQSGTTLLGLLQGLEPMELQGSALTQLEQYPEVATAAGVIEQWRHIGPGLRPQAIRLLLRRRSFHLPLIEAIESGTIGLGELNLDLEQRRLLRRYSSKEVKTRAATLFGDEEYSNRKTLLNDWLKKLPKEADIKNGQKIFLTQCASCHKSGEMGHRVGPNLTDMSHRSVEDLAFNILDPNMAIHPDYVAYEAETVDGELVTGIIESQTSESVTFVLAQGIRREIPRKQINALQSGGLSLMPEGLEEQLTPTELRDLIGFLQTP